MSTKVALITGAAQRVGRAFALHLAEQGYDLAIHYNSSQQAAEECKKLIEQQGGRAMTIQAALDDAKQVAGIIPAVNAELGEVSLLINNAAVFHATKFMATDVEQFERDLAINLRAPFFLAQDFARQLADKPQRADDAMIINLGDSAHRQLTSNHFLYRISKEALHHFTLLAAKELAPAIRVNAIAPGPALPPPGEDESHLSRVAGTTPLGLASPPSSLVQGLEYLLAAKTVTGQVLYIDSGMHLSHR